jgi:hypothetical protein
MKAMTMARKPSTKGSVITPAQAKNARPSDIHSSTVDDLYEEAKLWLEPDFKIETEAQAEGITKLRDLSRQARDAADDDRKVEAKPFDDGKAEVQGRYNPITKKAQRIIDGCNARLTPWNNAIAYAQERAAEETRRAAEEAAQRAAQAIQSAKGDLGAMEIAEGAIDDAKRLQRTANKLQRTAGKGTGMRTVWSVQIADRKAALYHYLAKNPDAFVELLLQLAEKDVSQGVRKIDGFEITSHKENV